MTYLKDRVLLIVVGIVAALLAATFFITTGKYAEPILLLVLFGYLFFDNRSLRKKVKVLEEKLKSPE